MPINIYDLAEDRKTLTIEYPSDSLTITYRPNQLTPARELAILRQARAESDDEDDEIGTAEYNINRQLKAFCELVEGWDFEGPLAKDKAGDVFVIPKAMVKGDQAADDSEIEAYCESHGATLLVPKGHVVPIQPEFLKVIGSNFLMDVTRRINKDMSPDPKRRRN